MTDTMASASIPRSTARVTSIAISLSAPGMVPESMTRTSKLGSDSIASLAATLAESYEALSPAATVMQITASTPWEASLMAFSQTSGFGGGSPCAEVGLFDEFLIQLAVIEIGVVVERLGSDIDAHGCDGNAVVGDESGCQKGARI